MMVVVAICRRQEGRVRQRLSGLPDAMEEIHNRCAKSNQERSKSCGCDGAGNEGLTGRDQHSETAHLT